MRPIVKTTSNTNYSPPATLGFNATNLQIVQTALGVQTIPTLKDCLQLWLESVPDSVVPHKRPSNPTMDMAVGIIEKKIGPIYQKAARPLIMEYGDYCSFCEARLSSTIEVEHRLPKSHYPDLSVNWGNFLLACGPCNRAKSNDSDRSKVKQMTANRVARQPGTVMPPFATDTDYHDEIVEKEYVWPNENDRSYQLLPSQLEYEPATGQWQPVAASAWDHRDTAIKKTDWQAHTITAYIVQLGGTYPVRVLVQKPPAKLASVHDTARAKDTVDLCQLNKHSSHNGVADRRVMQRTQAWFAAINTLKLLRAINRQIRNGNATPHDFDNAFDLVKTNAIATGFFSVWLTVFATANTRDKDPNGVLVTDRFVQEMQSAFCNTVTTHLP